MAFLDLADGPLNRNGSRGKDLVRTAAGCQHESFRLHLADLLKDGDVNANAFVLPGDVIIIPQSYF